MIFIAHQPGKYLPREYMRFKFDCKKIEKLRGQESFLGNEPPLTPLTPYSSSSNTKEFHITTTEIHTGSRV
jgi:hypothetical protein